MKSIAYVGMDVHKMSISIAVLPVNGADYLYEVKFANTEASIVKHLKKLNSKYDLRCCYEAGGCGYVIQRQLSKLGVACEIIAPSKIPITPGKTVKTDKLDARKLARYYRAGELTTIHIPTEAEESDRALVRLRETFSIDIRRDKQHILKYLTIRGFIYPGKSHWTLRHWEWMRGLQLAKEDQFILDSYIAHLQVNETMLQNIEERIHALAASPRYKQSVGKLCCFRGIDVLTAMCLLVEVIDFKRFGSSRKLSSYLGLVPSERSSGESHHRGGITKAGNSRCRRVLIDAAWNNIRRPNISAALKRRQEGQSALVIAHAYKAQVRLYKRFGQLTYRISRQKAVVAITRELCGFIWAVMNDKYESNRAVTA